MAVVEQLKRFENGGGKVLWVDQVPNSAEQTKNDQEVKKTLKKARKVDVNQIAGLIENSFSPEFDLTFTPGTDQLTIGRFHKKEEQVYLLVNRKQEALSVDVMGKRDIAGAGKIKVLDPSTGKIREISLPASLPLQANRSLLLMPGKKYLEQDLIKK